MNDEILRNNANVIILIVRLMLKYSLNSKDVLYQSSSDLGEENSFDSSSFSDTCQKDLCLSKFEKPCLLLGEFSNQSYYFFILRSLAAFKDKVLHMDKNEVFGTRNLILFLICFKYMFNQSTKAQTIHIMIVHQFIELIATMTLMKIKLIVRINKYAEAS